MSAPLWKFIIFGVVGIFGEVIFTAILSIFQTRRLRLMGFSFVWMFPIYGLLAFLFLPVYDHIAHYSWMVRGVIYMILIYLVEYVSGTILTALTGAHVWQYTDKFNYKGQVTLLYIPVWFSVGLMVEKYYPWVEKVSRLLYRAS